MENFTYHNPVRIHFGKGQIAKLSEELPTDQPILLLYGGGSIKRNGVYDQVLAACGDRQVIQFDGIEPNPTCETCMKAAKLAREKNVGFLLSVGGGSVLDAAKFIAAAAKYEGNDPWDIMVNAAPVNAAIPLGAVLTLPATGSEMNCVAVISNKGTQQKRHFGSPLVYPVFSILDPTTTYSLPPRQLANGIADAFTHVLEQYLTRDVNTPLQDRWAEGVLLTLIEEAPQVMADKPDYDSRANFMWSATCALNGLISLGAVQDWATHMIGHELTALYNIDHARTLAVVLPALLKVQKPVKLAKLVHYGQRVWNITASDGNDERRADLAIEKTRQFYESLGIPTKLSEYQDIKPDTGRIVAERLEKQGMTALGENQDITPDKVKEIFALCV